MSLNISVLKEYKNRNILLTGTTGFLGKVLLAMMLDHVPSTGCIYVLIRKDKAHSALERFIQKITHSPVFDALCTKHGEAFSRFITQRVKVLEGDITLPQLGLDQAMINHLQTQLDLVINIAGLVDFFPDLHSALEINVYGALQAAEFVRHCQKATLMHVSTCYVAGINTGTREEAVNLHFSPNHKPFDAEQELQFITDKIQQIIRDNRHQKRARLQLTALGKERADFWGWINTYCYTKALAEFLLVTRYREIALTIVRPSIIESAWRFPFNGWNEGLNTCAPMTYLSGNWYPFVLGRKKHILDVVPIDYVTNAMILVGAAALCKQAKPVYQLSSSQINPLTFEIVKSKSRDWHRTRLKKNGTSWAQRHLQTLLPLKCIGLTHLFAPKNITAFITKIEKGLKKIGDTHLFIKKITSKLTVIKTQLNRIEKIFKIFSPFTHDYDYIFNANNIREIQPTEAKFNYDLKTLNWKDYWYNIHMPGMNRWIFPLYTNQTIVYTPTQLAFTEQQKMILISSLTTD